ncbi:septum formation family protein [Myceligenerans pegani]|uniref:Septum formation family protein n=1 Tax=Myceligenerans pegani TaxID=2776917 RepID=A0ABR9MWE7_9MICO|nr:septum formation family protein [Myceligenerans sp. TRM 65318]MBE1875183.1 septum formation family protein [Myceligenerans sp. TRM 65318]MBE3017454.1 septum formation family protein [Myceligenerans sp. TRM 65318]
MLLRTKSPAARRVRATTAVVGAALVAGLLSGCSAIDGFLDGSSDEAPRDENGEITEASDADAMAVEIGDCLDVTALENQATFTDLPVMPCDEEHTGEIYAEKDLANGEYPGEKDVTDEADAFCESEFEAFVGLPYADSELYFWSFYPTEESWEQEDRTIQCVVQSEEPVTETLEGVER